MVEVAGAVVVLGLALLQAVRTRVRTVRILRATRNFFILGLLFIQYCNG